MNAMEVVATEDLRTQYQDNQGRAERLREAVVNQLDQLFTTNDVTLGVPIESRVKAWASIEDKIQRKSIELTDICQLQDLIGIRIILLFKSDLEKVQQLVTETLDVVLSEDTGRRLGESEFGYQSQHFIVRVPKTWLQVPIFSSLGDLFIELQIRTLAQHIWAAASHKLQYKSEFGVPPPLRRTINRVSALLETVDLEFDRVLEERRTYVASARNSANSGGPLNVDSLAAALAEELPAANKKITEGYAQLLTDLTELGVDSATELKLILKRHMKAVMAKEAAKVAEESYKTSPDPEMQERIAKGVFFAHVGLVRAALREEFGEKAKEVFDKRLSKMEKIATKKEIRKGTKKT